MLTNVLIYLGAHRDWAGWFWGRVLSAAAIVASGVFDLAAEAAKLGITLSPTVVHVITVASVAVLWVSGKQATSNLPRKDPA